MAIRISLAAPMPPASLSNPSPVATSFPLSRPKFLAPPRRDGEAGSGMPGGASCFFASRDRVLVRSGLETGLVTVGQVTEVNNDTFWPIVQAASPKIVVLDMYTQWCGPCKVIAPKFQELSEKYVDVVFLKLDCNQANKTLAKELGIRAVPTFKILKDCKIVKEVTGAKYDELVHAINTVRSG